MADAHAETDKNAPAVLPRGFQQILYWFSGDQTIFDLKKFRGAIPTGVAQVDDGFLFFAPRAGESGVYHASLAWSVTGGKVEFQLQYERGAHGHAANETAPYSEDLMQWLGSFFQSPSVPCHAHARFRYQLARREPRFPFVLSSSPPLNATVSGVALQLPTKPHGATAIRLTRGARSWYVEVISERQITFNAYELKDDISTALTVLDLFLQESSR